MQIGNRFKIGKQRKNNFNNQKDTASDKNNLFGIFIIKFKSRLRFNLLTALIGGVMKIQCTYSDGQNGKNQKNEHL